MDSNLRRIISVPGFDELRRRREYVEPVASVEAPVDVRYSQRFADQVESTAAALESFILDWSEYFSQHLPVSALVDYVVAGDLSSISRWEALASSFLEQWDREQYEAGAAYIGAAGLLRDMTDMLSFLSDGMAGGSSGFRSDVRQALLRADGSAAGAYRRVAVDIGSGIESSWLGMDISPVESSVATLVSNTIWQINDVWREMTGALFTSGAGPSDVVIDDKTRMLLITWIRSTTRHGLKRVQDALRSLLGVVEVMIVMRTFKIRRVRIDWDTLVKDYLLEPLERQLRAQLVRFVMSRVIPVIYRLLDVADDLESIAEIVPGDEPDRSVRQFIVMARSYIEQAKYYVRYLDVEQSRRNVLAIEYSKAGADIARLRSARNIILRLIQFLEENAHYAQHEGFEG